MFTIQEICDKFIFFLDVDVHTWGRIVSVRRMKKSIFIDLALKTFKIQCRFDSSMSPRLGNGDLVEVLGKCFYTNTKEPTINVHSFSVIAEWKADVGYRNITKSGGGPFRSFLHDAYARINFSQSIRNFIRQFLTSKDYLEVQTPILGKNYNGGKSFPVISSYLGNRTGYNRTTMEDRMQALIAAGYEKIFQMGSVFRSERENTFLEGYGAFVSWEEGKELIKGLLSYVFGKVISDGFGKVNNIAQDVVDKNWFEIDFFDKTFDIFGLDRCLINRADDKMIDLLIKKRILKSGEKSLENIADEIANTLAESTGVPTIINGFPIWSSPLYAPYEKNEAEQIQRSRLYLPGQKGGFEIGIQDNNYDRFIERLAKQRKFWNLSDKDVRISDSYLAKVISGGVPPAFGFGLSPDRISKIWRDDCSIDPYQSEI